MQAPKYRTTHYHPVYIQMPVGVEKEHTGLCHNGITQ